ncbi:hypothetical protein Hanom_Chr16g01430891 [Helianthus anomalus]
MGWFLVDFIRDPNEHTNEWRPPWRLANTSPNADGRFEWRPPWGVLFEGIPTFTLWTW